MQFMSCKGASGRLWLLLQIHVSSSRSRDLEITRVFCSYLSNHAGCYTLGRKEENDRGNKSNLLCAYVDKGSCDYW